MKNVSKRSHKNSIAIALAFFASIAVSSAGAETGVSILDDAILDYAGQAPTNEVSRGSNSDVYASSPVLGENYYDWAITKHQDLEEADFAAFEVPDALQGHD